MGSEMCIRDRRISEQSITYVPLDTEKVTSATLIRLQQPTHAMTTKRGQQSPPTRIPSIHILSLLVFITFRLTCRRREMYSGDGCLCVCLSVPRRTPTLLLGPRCNLENDRGCPLVVHNWADLQSVHRFRCYVNIARTRDISECLYSLYAWL